MITFRLSVHPRVCGEHLFARSQSSGWRGSSPRLRGTRGRRPCRCLERRFIPAFAGNTARARADPNSVSVHPRVCGEHAAKGKLSSAFPGSSPRLRGTPPARTAVRASLRFIPAFAGNTAQAPCPVDGISVHPRVCGEHADELTANSQIVGSSPRLRGTPSASAENLLVAPVIPAFAGNTRIGGGGRAYQSVHPRVCGEHLRATE